MANVSKSQGKTEVTRPVLMARVPRQNRGQMRVDKILDAAASVVSMAGVGAITMHDLAKRSDTSIGSMYHFFPDRESVVTGLRERHLRSVQAITQELLQTPSSQWATLSGCEAVSYLISPYAAYLSKHADYLPLMQGTDWADDEGGFMQVIKHMLAARLPEVGQTQRSDYAVMLHAVAAGAMYVGSVMNPKQFDLCLREIPIVLNAYLMDLEARQRLDAMDGQEKWEDSPRPRLIEEKSKDKQ